MDLFEKTKGEHIYDIAKEKGIYPYFHKLTTGQDVVVDIEGKNTIMIGSNNYLGLTSHQEIKEVAKKAIDKYGSGCSGSRFLNGTLDLHVELENELARFLKKDKVITFSTGFQANLGVISAIAGRGDFILCDKENHASIYDGCRLSYAKLLRYEHSDMEDLERKLKLVPEDNGILIVTDGVFSMGGDICKLPEIVKLAKKYGARIMVDDAHALGVLGKHGRGTAEYFGLEDDVDIYMGTFSKSLASLGGYIASSARVIDYITHTSRPYIFSASMTPASVASALTALRILEREPERMEALKNISSYMREGLKKMGIQIIESQTPIIPIYTYDDEKAFMACKLLLDRGVYVNPVVSPATPVGKALIRTSYTATHTKEQMDTAMAKIQEVMKILEII